MNPKENAKAGKERAIFDAFLKCGGAPTIESDSVESRPPPEPDILCKSRDRALLHLSSSRLSRASGLSLLAIRFVSKKPSI